MPIEPILDKLHTNRIFDILSKHYEERINGGLLVQDEIEMTPEMYAIAYQKLVSAWVYLTFANKMNFKALSLISDSRANYATFVDTDVQNAIWREAREKYEHLHPHHHAYRG